MSIRPMPANIVWCGVWLLGLFLAAAPAGAQPLGTFRWQLQPFCNVVVLTVTGNGDVFRLDGTDDQCGAAEQAAALGTAFRNPEGTLGLGLTIVASGGTPIHVDATLPGGGFDGTWRDSAGHAGVLRFSPGAGTGGVPRPLPPPPAAEVPPAFQLKADGGFVATGTLAQGLSPAAGPGTRMTWHPGKAAFRTGRAFGTEWDEALVGRFSVAMGEGTTASGAGSLALGRRTTAAGDYAVAGGAEASAPGFGATALGNNVTAAGAFSVALGSFVTVGATSPGTFVFGDQSTENMLRTQLPNQFIVRATGGTAFYSSSAPVRTGVVLLPGSGAWSVVSDVRTKEHFRDWAGEDVLARFRALPVREWNYRSQDASVRHMGPTAQDFHAAFGLGEDAVHISTIDADGVALAGVKALETRTRALSAENGTLRAQLEMLRAEVLSRQTAAVDEGPGEASTPPAWWTIPLLAIIGAGLVYVLASRGPIV